MRLAKRLSELLAGRQGVLLQLRRRGDRVRAQARPQAPRRRGTSWCSSAASTGAPTGRCRPRRRRPSRRRSRRSCPASAPCRRTTRRRSLAAVGERTAAVIVEAVQGEGGIHPLESGLLEAARAACDEHGALLIFDEIQCGLGPHRDALGLRARRRAARRDDARQGARRRAADRRLRREPRASPTCSSPATTARPSPAARWSPRRPTRCSTRWTTARPPGCASQGRAPAARAARGSACDVRGQRADARLRDRRRRPRLVARALAEQRLVLNATGPDTVRLLPPLNVSEAEIDEAVGRIGAVL